MCRCRNRKQPVSPSPLRILIAAVGRARRGPEEALFRHYLARMRWHAELREIAEARGPTPEAQRREEAGRLRATMPEGARLVALDERGQNIDSVGLATQLGRWRDDGIRDATFAIGGAEGLDPALVESADLVIAFGRATWPHMLVRGMLAEQLYRAETILGGHPYHRGGP
ncbi:MAG: 23S rRNA (pseudouridine(1915)-N(3))-methyltransferase RlmH [Acetobacterales bacterium]